ncbi:hypothetical protein ACRRTK_006228 [Alexandromys fortis]
MSPLEGKSMQAVWKARLTTDQDLLLMQEGMMMRKVRTRFWKKLRFFRLQNDGMTVWHARQADDVAKLTFSISDVETIRKGHDSELLRNLMEEFPLEQGFTIVFHGRRPNLDLVASSVEEAQIWMRGLQLLVDLVASMDHQEQLDQKVTEIPEVFYFSTANVPWSPSWRQMRVQNTMDAQTLTTRGDQPAIPKKLKPLGASKINNCEKLTTPLENYKMYHQEDDTNSDMTSDDDMSRSGRDTPPPQPSHSFSSDRDQERRGRSRDVEPRDRWPYTRNPRSRLPQRDLSLPVMSRPHFGLERDDERRSMDYESRSQALKAAAEAAPCLGAQDQGLVLEVVRPSQKQ